MVRLYLMGEKGLIVLKHILSYKSIINGIVGSRDKNVQNDYYDEIRHFCVENGIPFYDKSENPALESKYQLALGWRWMIPQSQNTQLIVLHDSLLPKYRGFAPLPNMLINHEPAIGVTALFASDEYDKGDIIQQKSIEINYPIRINDAISIVSRLYADIVSSILEMVLVGSEIQSVPQTESEASYSLWRNEEDYAIDWTKDATYIQQFVYSLGFPYKGASTQVDGVKYRILDCELVADVKIENRDPGKVIFMKDGYPTIVCGSGLLKITKMETEDGVSCLPMNKFRVWFK